MKSLPQPSISLIGRKHIPLYMDLALCVLTLGAFYVVCKISGRMEILLKTYKCSLADADCVVILDSYDNEKLFFVRRIRITTTFGLRRYIRLGYVMVLDTAYGRFVYDHFTNKFISPLFPLNADSKNVADILLKMAVQSKAEADIELYEKSILYGPNISTARPPTIAEILENNIFNTVFIWELLSVIFCISIKYYNYVAVVGAVYIYLFFEQLLGDLRHRSKLATLCAREAVRLFRNGAFVSVSEAEIYPGDIICISPCSNFKCDAKILKGDVITDESFLTGESVPVCKGPGSSVYAGTQIIKSTCETISFQNIYMEKLVKVKNLLKNGSAASISSPPGETKLSDVALGIVVRTGRRTKRGIMLTNLASKKPVSSNLAIQSINVTITFLGISIIITLVSMIFLSQHLTVWDSFIYSFDVLITFFSPSLHTARDLGVYHSRKELQAKGINSADPARIGTAGEVDVVVFDKTGTLTETDVDILCVDTLDERVEEFSDLGETIRFGISTCHYVMELDEQYSGDILDMKMFMFSNSSIINYDGKRYIGLATNRAYEPICREEGHPEAESSCMIFKSGGSVAAGCQPQIEVVRIFDFDSYLKRMSVVVRTAAGKSLLFCKGAPDSLRRILGSVPPEYDERVNEYALQGYRVITLAYREVDECPPREAGERGLCFCGFVVFANRLKEETCGVIAELRAAGIAPKMCTGDNILTAISVARECGMIERETPVLFPVMEDEEGVRPDAEWYCVAEEDYIFDKVKLSLYSEFDRSESVDFVVACEGREYELFKGTAYHGFILERGGIFARFNPENKKSLIEDYSGTRHTTMYCGDGANDTGALSAADVGLSLATNEASLAASFNSVDLGAVLELVKEGRSALAMSAAQFKYMFYAQALAGIQMSVLLPYLYFPTDIMSLVTDILGVYVLGYAIYHFKASNIITPRKLLIRLSRDVFYLSAELAIIIGILVTLLFSLGSSQHEGRIEVVSKHATASFFIVISLYIIKAAALSSFSPHRQSRMENKTFLAVISSCTMLALGCFLSLIFENRIVTDVFEFAALTKRDLLLLSGGVVASCLVSAIFALLSSRG